ncbi:MAG: MBL fold metallo-hydrolase [Burkholderiales bacterium]|nr:MBL fold metallo-hydrolase [Burkholderiales bacterium]
MNHEIPTMHFGPVTIHFGEKNGKYPDGNQVIVRGAEATAIFDTPLAANRIPDVIREADLAILGHVHEDHMAGLHLVPQVPLFVHEADAPAARSWEGMARHYGYGPEVLPGLRRKIETKFHYQPRPDAIAYADGQVWDLGGGVRVRALHMPGHTAGHSVLLVEPEGVAFIGDIDLSSFGPYYGDASSDLAAFRRSLARLPELPASVWVTSHHKGVVTERAKFLEMLQAYAARLDERSERLLQMLQAGPATIDELVRQRLLYPPEADELWIDSAEQRTITLHLAELCAAGRVRERDDGRFALA